jgi:valyl-tRNA synthetase
VIPFVTEEIWQRLREIDGRRQTADSSQTQAETKMLMQSQTLAEPQSSDCDSGDEVADSAAVCRLPSAVYLEDQWIQSRLATVTKSVTQALETYHYADAMRELYDFAWDEFCSFYVEMVKSRLFDPAQRQQAQSVLVHVLSTLIRLLHPVIPFVTEEIWHQLNERGALAPCSNAKSIATAPYPVTDESLINPEVERQFAVFQELLRAVRDVRASRNVPPKTVIEFAVRCDAETEALLKPMEPYFLSMASCRAVSWGPQTAAFALSATVPLAGMDVFVDLSDLIDVPAEIAKLEKEIAKLDGFIQSKESKLSGDFVQKAPPAVVEKERQSLEEFRSQRTSAIVALKTLTERKS